MIFGVLLVGGAGIIAATFPGVQKTFAGLFKPSVAEIIKYKAGRGKLAITVVERGNLESAANKDVLNEVEGNTTIIWIKPEGTQVKKGELVCELDSATHRDNLVNQEITTKRAKADLENAEKTRVVAEIAVNEYLNGTFPQEKQTIQGEIKLAEAELARASDRLTWSMEMLRNKYVSESQVLADKMSRQKSEITLLNANTKAKVLEKYTKDKQTTELEANVKKAVSDELAKKSTFELERQKEEKLKKMIAKCKLVAPADGLIVYANETNQMRGGSGGPLIEEGATVRERQKIFSLPDITHMRVNTKVHESMVDRVQKGLPAHIKVDALPNVGLAGTVSVVQPLPDPSGMFSSDVKQYTTLISIENYVSALRPGMTAQVEILVTQLDDVLTIPVQSIIQAQGKDWVFVLTPEGPVRKEVKLGLTNQKMMEIKEGLKVGDEVAMNWNALMSEEEKNALFNSSTKNAAKTKEWANIPPADKAKLSPGLATGKTEAKGETPTKGAEAKAKGKGQGNRGGGGGMPAALREKMKGLAQEDRMKLFSGSEDEKAAILKGAGFTDDELKQYETFSSQMRERMKNMPPGGGGGGFGGPGGGGGGPGGGGGGFGPRGGGGQDGGGNPQ
ncbi:MAG: macA 6 [Planctomycetota bacterium]|nr:macA 6 [Planctomycetota bacterium]